jgi:zinc-binding alcohol dehydrogenase/oxidoreductase
MNEKKMKAILFKEVGKLPELEIISIPIIEDHQHVRMSHAALNHRDLWIVKGMYAGLKTGSVLGSDGVGYLEDKPFIINPGIAWGEDQRVQSKQFRVLGMPDFGTFAEYIPIESKYLYPKPAHMSNAEAASFPLAGLTAYRALMVKCQPQPGEKALITGVGGGVAVMALQLALAAGLECYVSSGSEEKIQKAIYLGAKGGANYNKDDWDKQLIEMAGGFDVVIDSAAGTGFSKLVKACNPGGRISIYGGTTGKIDNVSPQIIFWKQISIFGSSMGSDKDFMEMLSFVEKHKIKPVVDSIFELHDYNKAFLRLESGEHFGKVVMKISND